MARCDSVLEVRDRLLDAASEGTPWVLLTSLGEDELGADVVARLAKRHLFSIEPWQLVKERFQARHVDPRLVQGHPWVARLLVEAEPAGGYPPAPSGFVQADLAWQVLFESFLGLPDGARDAETLLEWSLDQETGARAASLTPEALAGLGDAMLDSEGPAAHGSSIAQLDRIPIGPWPSVSWRG